ncbi:hypothetical protein ACEPAF_1709 [Sanghuangporus sanghuang]
MQSYIQLGQPDAEGYNAQTMQCDAFGPLSPYNTVLLANCIPEQWYTCLATDSTGCMAGDPSNIEELVVRDPSTAAPAGGAASISEAPFCCSETGMVSCSVIFTEEGTSKASLYGLNIIHEEAQSQSA